MNLSCFKYVELTGFNTPQPAIISTQLAALLPHKFSHENIEHQYDFAAWGIEQYSRKGVKRKYWILKEDADRIEQDPKIFISRVKHHFQPVHVRPIIVRKNEQDKNKVVHQQENKTQVQIALIVCITILIISALAMIMFK